MPKVGPPVEGRTSPEVPGAASTEIYDGDDDDEYDYYEDDFEDEDFESDEEEPEDPDLQVSSASLPAKGQPQPEARPSSIRRRAAALDRGSLREVKEQINLEDLVSQTRDPVLTTTPSTAEKLPTRAVTGLGAVDFAAAKQRQQRQQQQEQLIREAPKKSRGDELLAMIRLDVATFQLLDLAPVPYDLFMKTYGSGNTLQAQCQTGDARSDEATQTEAIDLRHRAVQCPPSVSDGSNVRGGAISYDEFRKRHRSSLRLVRFLRKAGHLMLSLVEVQEAPETHRNNQEDNDNRDELAFAQNLGGGPPLSTSRYPFLSGRPVSRVALALDQPEIFMSVHNSDPHGSSTLTAPAHQAGALICTWSLSKPDQVRQVMVSEGRVSACCLSPVRDFKAFAGLEDGTLCLWDLREGVTPHQEIYLNSEPDFSGGAVPPDGAPAITFLSPTFLTSGGGPRRHPSSGGDRHGSRITGLLPLGSPPDGHGTLSSSSMQVVSIEEDGRLIVWTVLRGHHDAEHNLGLAPWGSVRLVPSFSVDLKESLSGNPVDNPGAHCLTSSVPDQGRTVLIGSDKGLVLNVPIVPGHKPNPKVFSPEYDTASNCTSVSTGKFGTPGFVLVASDDGMVRLHSCRMERPLITWQGTADQPSPIRSLVWSPTRPCVFIVLDTQSRLHLWDLGAGDIFPKYCVKLKSNCRDIAVARLDKEGRQMLLLATDEGQVLIHHLKAEYVLGDAEELDRFLHYVSII